MHMLCATVAQLLCELSIATSSVLELILIRIIRIRRFASWRLLLGIVAIRETLLLLLLLLPPSFLVIALPCLHLSLSPRISLLLFFLSSSFSLLHFTSKGLCVCFLVRITVLTLLLLVLILMRLRFYQRRDVLTTLSNWRVLLLFTCSRRRHVRTHAVGLPVVLVGIFIRTCVCISSLVIINWDWVDLRVNKLCLMLVLFNDVLQTAIRIHHLPRGVRLFFLILACARRRHEPTERPIPWVYRSKVDRVFIIVRFRVFLRHRYVTVSIWICVCVFVAIIHLDKLTMYPYAGAAAARRSPLRRAPIAIGSCMTSQPQRR